MNMELEKSLLEAAGYKQFDSQTERGLKYCDVMFQKRFGDEQGKRYFLTIWGYRPRPEYQQHGWSWECGLHINTPHMAFHQYSIVLKEKANLDLMEKRARLFWETMGRPYYERFDDYEKEDEL